MKKVFGNLTSRAGEVVGHYKKTGLDDNILVLEQTTKATKNTADDLLKHLSPTGGLLTGFTSKGEGKVGEQLVDSGNKLMAADSGSNFGRAVVSVGECWKDINEAQKTCNERVMDGLVQPIKGFTEGPLKEAGALKKKVDAARLEYDSAQRALQKKNDSLHQDEFNNAERKFQESKEQYNQKMEEIQGSEDERTEWLKHYVAAQLAYHEKCVALLNSLSSELDSQGGRSRVSSKRAGSDDFSDGASPYGASAGTSSYGSSSAGAYTSPVPPVPTYGATPTPTSTYNAPPPTLPPQRPPRASSNQTCRALYDFQGASDSELNFSTGQVITILNKIDDDWYEGEVGGAVGIFPANYVEML